MKSYQTDTCRPRSTDHLYLVAAANVHIPDQDSDTLVLLNLGEVPDMIYLNCTDKARRHCDDT